MKLWLAVQLPQLLAPWISEPPFGIDALAVRELGLRDASDRQIFQQARAEQVVVMTKDRDFIRLLDEQGPPPQVIWLRVGNSSNEALRAVLSRTLPLARELLLNGEPWVEIRPPAAGS